MARILGGGDMNAVTLKNAKLNLEKIIADVIANAEDTIIVTDSGEQVVIMSLDEYDSWARRASKLSPH